MCVVHKIGCRCGKGAAEMSMLDELLGPDAVRALYCPECSRGVELDSTCMVPDNGWIVEYDMDAASACASRAGVSPDEVTPELVFDEGYCAWTGYTPDDRKSAALERAEILGIMKKDFRAYVNALTSWGKERARRLGEEGWRKARAAM